MSEHRPRLEVICSDIESRALLEQLKISCKNGWFFETLRIEPDGFMIYRFFLVDLSKQKILDDEKFVRYFGFVEATETNDAVVIKVSGDLECFVDTEMPSFLLERFHEDVLEPVCRRQRMRISYAKSVV